jgi:hypothetical protein
MVRHTFGPPRLLLCVIATTCLGACSGGLERVSSPCPSGQELREVRYDPTSIKSQGCVGRNSENNYRRQGRWEFFYPSGQKQVEATYRDGKREGLQTLWTDYGQKRRETTYRDGKREGLQTEWYDNGKKKEEATYRDGKNEGLYTWWYPNGQKKWEATYLNDTETSVTAWGENGDQR